MLKEKLGYYWFSSMFVSLWLVCPMSYATVAYSQLFSQAYSASQPLNFYIDYNGAGYPTHLGMSTVSGNFYSQIAQTGPNCFYFNLSAANVVASYDGINIGIANFTTPWCRYVGGTVTCPVYQTANFLINNIASSLSFTLSMPEFNQAPAFSVQWNETYRLAISPTVTKASIAKVPVKAAIGSTTIGFPLTNFSGIISSKEFSTNATASTACMPPS